MTVDRLFTSRQDGTYRLSLFMELTQGVDVNFVIPCMLPGHVSKGPFQRYGVRRHLVNRARKVVTRMDTPKSGIRSETGTEYNYFSANRSDS